MSENNLKLPEVQIKVNFTKTSLLQLESSIRNIEKYLSPEIKHIIIGIYVDLGKPEGNKVLKYVNRENMSIVLQPKIKNYIPFKNKDNYEKYRDEELEDKDLYLCLDVVDGKIQINSDKQKIDW